MIIVASQNHAGPVNNISFTHTHRPPQIQVFTHRHYMHEKSTGNPTEESTCLTIILAVSTNAPNLVSFDALSSTRIGVSARWAAITVSNEQGAGLVVRALGSLIHSYLTEQGVLHQECLIRGEPAQGGGTHLWRQQQTPSRSGHTPIPLIRRAVDRPADEL